MARKLKTKQAVDIENIVLESLTRVGIKKIDDAKLALLTRLIFSGVAHYFFRSPDNVVEMGFLKFVKNPEKDQLFAINIRRNETEGIYDAATLWKYYKGELVVEEKLRNIMEKFVENLMEYSQAQEQDISKLTRKMS